MAAALVLPCHEKLLKLFNDLISCQEQSCICRTLTMKSRKLVDSDISNYLNDMHFGVQIINLRRLFNELMNIFVVYMKVDGFQNRNYRKQDLKLLLYCGSLALISKIFGIHVSAPLITIPNFTIET